MREIKKGAKLVLIEWVDSRSPTRGWDFLDDIKTLEYCNCISVGFLLVDGKDQKVIAPNFADVEEEESLQVSAVKVIPTCCVTSIKYLEEK